MKKHNRRNVILAIAGVLCILGIFYFVIWKGEQIWRSASLKDAAENENTGEMDRLLWKDIKLNKKKYRYSRDFETYLIIGTDASGNEAADREEYIGNMADFLLLAVINRTDGTYAFLQLNRDTMTEVSLLDNEGRGRATAEIQLCTAHWYGGTPEESCENTVKAVSDMLGGISIEGYYAINMSEISRLNHAVGGVTVTIEDDFSNIDETLRKGETITLNDEQAMNFVRSRMGMENDDNTARMARQRQYLNALLEKVKEKTADDSEFALGLYDELSDVSDTNMSGGLISDLLIDMSEAESKGILSLQGETKLGKHLGDGLEHAEFYLDKSAIVNTMKLLYNIEENEKIKTERKN